MKNREYTLQGTLTSKILEDMDFRTVFARGEVKIGSEMRKWIAITDMMTNWAIFWGNLTDWDEWIWRAGRKLNDEKQIKSLVPCDDEAFAKYK